VVRPLLPSGAKHVLINECNQANLVFGKLDCASVRRRSHQPWRPYWRCYYPQTSAIIYVIDSSDTARLQTSRAELLTMLSEDELREVPLLVFCNKQDVPGALEPGKISEELGLAGGEKGREWSVRGSSAIKGEGLEEGLDW